MRAALRIVVLAVTFFPIVTAPGAVAQTSEDAKVWGKSPPELSSLAGLDYREILPEASASPETAQRLNSLGFDAYRQDRLIEAARLFRAALEMDNQHAYAHYNYAALLAIFAQGFTCFDAKPRKLHSLPVDRTERILEYRDAIFDHLKQSISLRQERLARVTEDPDFDTVRELTAYEYLLMGRNPSMRTVVARSPKWYSVQPGAFLPQDTLVFLPDYRVRFSYDTRRFELFPDIEDKRDRSFTGVYRIDGKRLIIFPDGSPKVVYGTVSVKLDDRGFVVRKHLELEGYGPFGDREQHYREGQDA